MDTQKEPEISSDSLLTSYQVGTILQVNPSSVNKWIKDGRIPAFRTPGGHRRIRAADLVAFLSQHEMPVPPSLVHAAKRRLLVVDDDPRHLEAMQRLMKPYEERVDVAFAQNGVDALVQVGSFSPGMLVLDVMMPGMDGIEVCRRLKANEDTKAIQVIMVSGQMTPEIEQRAKAAGAFRCMHKPVDLQAVLKDLGINPTE